MKSKDIMDYMLHQNKSKVTELKWPVKSEASSDLYINAIENKEPTDNRNFQFCECVCVCVLLTKTTVP